MLHIDRAAEEQVTLLHYDKDFELIAEATGQRQELVGSARMVHVHRNFEFKFSMLAG